MGRKNKNKAANFYDLVVEGSSVFIKPLMPVSIFHAGGYDKLTLDFQYLKDKTELTLDFSVIDSYDSYLVVFTLAIQKECEKRGVNFKLTGMSGQMEHYFEALTPKGQIEIEKKGQPFWIAYISNIGEITKTMLNDTRLFIEFLGELILKMLILLVKPGNMRWKDFPHHFMQTGVNAVPITVLILFLIGFISGYMGALQLSQFGADIFIADLIGISITRELAPLMTAIIVAGRSGSAFAAEIGTMKVSEEIDALKSMGFDHMKFLVIPRVVAVTFAMPILVLLTDVAGILGGLVAALTSLEITIAGYVNQLHRAIDFYDVFTGVGKGMVFGFLISTVGCFRGMQVHGGAESVGKYTTASVVTSIFLIIVFDSLFTYIFQMLGI